MESADPRKISHPGHQSHGVHLCNRCGWPYPNAHPSARHRRAHKRMCGTIEGFMVVAASEASLSHSHSQHSAVSTFSDEEHGSDGDSKAPSSDGVISTCNTEGGNGRVLERMYKSEDDIFTDAVAELADANGSLAGEEGLGNTTEMNPHKGVGVPNFSPSVEDSTNTGTVRASVNPENAKSRPPPEDGTTSPGQEHVVSFIEISTKFETMTDVTENIMRTDGFGDPKGLETSFTNGDDSSEINAVRVVVPLSEDTSKTSETVTEGRSSRDLTVFESEISKNEEIQDVESGSETFMNSHSQESKTLLCSVEEIYEVKVEDFAQMKFDELVTELVAEDSATTSPRICDHSKVVNVPSVPRSNGVVLVTSVVVDGIGASAMAAEIEIVKTSSAHTISGHESEDSNENFLDSMKRASANDDTGLTEGGGKVSESDVNLNNLYLDIGSEAPVNMLPHVAHKNATMEVFDDVPPFVAAYNQLDWIVEPLHTDKALEISSDVNFSLDDGNIGNNIGIGKEDKLGQADVSDSITDTKPVRHGVLLQKLGEDLFDDEPVESSQATESLSQKIGNTHQVNDGGVPCLDTFIKEFRQLQEGGTDPEKDKTVTVTDAPYEISSPNGSSLDGTWGSISDTAADIKKTKAAQGLSNDKSEIFNPPSSLTLVEPQAQITAAASSTLVEVQNPQQAYVAKATWFPSIANGANDLHGGKKNEIIAKVTNWSAGKQHSPLKTLLSKAKADYPNLNPSTVPKDSSPVKKKGTPVTTVNSIIGSQQSELSKEKLDTPTKEWSSLARYPDEMRREKREVKGKPYWVPFMCCSSVM